jgi:hypothetical protein
MAYLSRRFITGVFARLADRLSGVGQPPRSRRPDRTSVNPGMDVSVMEILKKVKAKVEVKIMHISAS